MNSFSSGRRRNRFTEQKKFKIGMVVFIQFTSTIGYVSSYRSKNETRLPPVIGHSKHYFRALQIVELT